MGYSQSHYESLHPCTNADILESINLVTEYLENRYRFSKQDLPFLIGLNGNSSIDQGAEVASCSFSKSNLKTNYEKKENEKEVEAPLQQKIQKYQKNLSNKSASKESNNATPSPMKKSKLCQVTENKSNINRKEQMNTPLSNHEETTLDTDINFEEIDDFLDDKIKRREKTTYQAEEEPNKKKLYKLKDKPTRSHEEATPSKILNVDTELNKHIQQTDLIDILEDDIGRERRNVLFVQLNLESFRFLEQLSHQLT